MALGVIMLITMFFIGITPALPGQLACVVGGGLAVGVYRASETSQSRFFGLWAAIMTFVGIAGVGLAMWLSEQGYWEIQ